MTCPGRKEPGWINGLFQTKKTSFSCKVYPPKKYAGLTTILIRKLFLKKFRMVSGHLPDLSIRALTMKIVEENDRI